MFLQGSLQNYFDALYQVGVIQEFLKLDWRQYQDKRETFPGNHSELIQKLNQTPHESLLSFFEGLPKESLYALALEVACEFADYSERKNLQ